MEMVVKKLLYKKEVDHCFWETTWISSASICDGNPSNGSSFKH